MRILLLANYVVDNETPVVAGWIQSLTELLGQSADLEIGLVCLINGEYEVRKQNNYTLYLISTERSGNPFYRIYRNITGKIDHPKWSVNFLRAIDDFQPDIVHIFGTESFLIELLPRIKQKVVVHIQGILTAYLRAWFPPEGYSKKDLYKYSFRFIDYLKGRTQIQIYRHFKKITRRELSYIGYVKYCMGRTDWDKRTIKSMNSDIRYFHVEEVLRAQFYEAKKWEYNDSPKIRLLSIISPSMYKGFDLILKTAEILKQKCVDFEWIVCGTDESDNIVYFFDKKLKVNHLKLNIKYVGKVDVYNIIDFMRSSDIYIHPSYIENSPNSVCEAQLLGMPVIAVDAGGLSSLIENGKNGILVPGNDAYTLSSEIVELKKNKSYIAELSVHARKTALLRHNRNVILDEIKRVYKEILEDKG